MIRLQIDTKEMMSEIQNKLNGAKELMSPSVLNELSKIVFTITSERFMISADSYARANPKKMHHVYEWGGIGNPTKRLFVLKRESLLGGDMVINSIFLPSRMPVPINPELLRAGKTGKAVTKKNIFRDKAEVMESSRNVSFTAKKVLAFMGSNGIVFIKPGTTINIAHPGGIGTKNAFAEYMLEWYITKGSEIMDASGVYQTIENEVASVLNIKGTGITQVKQAVARIANTIDNGLGVTI
jgi:hypothetical protein